MNSNAIVTLADSKYFELLEELINSIQSHEESKNVSICVLDAGLTNDQVSKLKKKVFSVKKAEWDIKVPGYKVLKKEWLKSQVSRAFLPKYFPDFTKYLWIDCDAWVNSWSTVELYFRACDNGKLGITQSIGPGYRIMSKVKWLLGKIAIIKSQNYKHAKASGIEDSISRKLAFAPHINIGVFSLEKDSECGRVWQPRAEARGEMGQDAADGERGERCYKKHCATSVLVVTAAGAASGERSHRPICPNIILSVAHTGILSQ